jgi:hypothetical protein
VCRGRGGTVIFPPQTPSRSNLDPALSGRGPRPGEMAIGRLNGPGCGCGGGRVRCSERERQGHLPRHRQLHRDQRGLLFLYLSLPPSLPPSLSLSVSPSLSLSLPPLSLCLSLSLSVSHSLSLALFLSLSPPLPSSKICRIMHTLARARPYNQHVLCMKDNSSPSKLRTTKITASLYSEEQCSQST